tara:strand:- start:1665 stop:2150 length:486 start_codon:yes stop_codon:yes gene_type:complete
MTGSHIGKTIYVAEAVPATNTDAGFEALTWVKVEGVQTLPQLGVSHSNIDVPDLETGFTSGLKGAGSGNDSTATFRLVDADAGQEDIRDLANASGTAANGSIKIVKGSGTDNAPTEGDPVQYAQGYFHSYLEIQGDDSTHEGFSVNFKQNALTIDATEPAA